MTNSSHHPDERDLLEFADAVNAGSKPQPRNELERTYLHVHSVMQGESAAMPSTTKQQTWEDVMSTLSLSPASPVSNRTLRQRQSIRKPNRTRRIAWSPMASVALAAVLVLASIGIWRLNTLPDDSMPPLAPQHAGITSGETVAQVPATADATAVDDASGMRSIPIIQHVDEQPMAGPVIWLTTAGDVMYDDGTGEVATIASGAFQVTPQTTNVIQVLTKAPEKDTTDKDGNKVEGYAATYHHLVSGMTLVDDGSFSSYLGGPNTFGPLTVLTIADAPREWSIVNFETMESKSIAELTGGQFRSSDSITVAVSDDYSTIAVATSTYESEASAILNRQSGSPGELAVFTEDLGDPTWVSVPEGMTGVKNISLAPDGSKIALIANERSEDGMSMTMTVSIIDIATNEELTRTDAIESGADSSFQWIENGDAFVAISTSSVQRFTVNGGDPTTLLESEGYIRQMPRMDGSKMIYLEVSTSDVTVQTPEADPATTELVILDPESGEAIRVQGDPWFQGGSYPVTFSVSLSPIPVSQDGETAVLVHPITGEEYPDLVADVYDPLRDPAFQPEQGDEIPFVQPVVTAPEANVSVVTLTDGTLAVFRTDTQSMSATVVERSATAPDHQLFLSPGGEYLTAGSSWQIQSEDDTYFVLDLNNPDGGWIQGEPGQSIDFLEVPEA